MFSNIHLDLLRDNIHEFRPKRDDKKIHDICEDEFGFLIKDENEKKKRYENTCPCLSFNNFLNLSFFKKSAPHIFVKINIIIIIGY